MTDTRTAPAPPAVPPPRDVPHTPQAGVEATADALVELTRAGLELLCVELGLRTGLYTGLAGRGPTSSRRLAATCGLDERYVREWLQQQATAGLVEVDGPDPATARFALVPGAARVLLDADAPEYLGPFGRYALVAARMLPQLEQAFRTGDGVPYAAYGPEAVRVQEEVNRPSFLHLTASEWLPALPDVLARLGDPARRARVADVGTGAGWGAIALAEAFPSVRVVGVDSDATSVARARANAAERRVGDRVSFHLQGGEDGLEGGPFDLVTFFECLHDMSHPVPALAAARAALAPRGTVLVMEERVADALAPTDDEVERLFAAISVVWCLPQSRGSRDSAALGTCLRPAALARLALQAGFARCTALPVDNPFWRFYRLDA